MAPTLRVRCQIQATLGVGLSAGFEAAFCRSNHLTAVIISPLSRELQQVAPGGTS
jgi:hypothetical protein